MSSLTTHTTALASTDILAPNLVDTSGLPLYRFSVDQFQQMGESGLFQPEQRVELLDGQVVDMTPIGPDHSATVEVLRENIQLLVPPGLCLRIQHPINFANSQPQPDMAIVRGQNRDFRTRHPRADEVLVIIEVADSSVVVDEGLKLRLYAAAGIPEYWLLNLVRRQIFVYRRPDSHTATYVERQVIEPSQSLAVTLDGKSVGEISARLLFE